MSYIPRIYWPERLAREGAKFVGRGGMDDKGVAKQAKQFLAHILPHIPEDCDDLLDYGCGVGRLTENLMTHCEFYTGVDICKQALAEAPDLLDSRWEGSEYIHLDEDHIPFSAGQFDCIVAVTVIQHIVDPDQFKLWMGELNRVADKGCTFIVVDNHLEGDGSGHCLARTPEVVAEALGIEIIHTEVISVDKKDSHWLLKGVKS